MENSPTFESNTLLLPTQQPFKTSSSQRATQKLPSSRATTLAPENQARPVSTIPRSTTPGNFYRHSSPLNRGLYQQRKRSFDSSSSSQEEQENLPQKDHNEDNDITAYDEDNHEEQNLVTEKNAEKRYGHKVKFERCVCPDFMRFLSAVIAILILPIQFFCQGFLKTSEAENLFIPLQSWLNDIGCDVNSTCFLFIRYPVYVFTPRVTAAIMVALSMGTDSLIAFKSAFLTCIGLYGMSVFNMFYKDSRPFWEELGISSYNICYFDFASPDVSMFILTFFYTYNLIMYRFKYVKYTSILTRTVSVIFVLLLVLAMAASYFSGVALGLNYVYQSFIGQMFGLIYLVFALAFDKEIHRMCEKSGFIVKASRGMKFEIFFACIAAFVALSIYYMCDVFIWDMPQVWVVNVLNNGQCLEKFLDNSDFMMGINQTFDLASSLFFIVGMVFGQSYSVQYVKPLLWVKTHWVKRIIRTILGTGLSVCIYLPFLYVIQKSSNASTKFMFRYAFPGLVISFVMYGLFPIACKYVQLVSKVNPTLTRRQRSQSVQRSVSVSNPGRRSPSIGQDLKPRSASDNFNFKAAGNVLEDPSSSDSSDQIQLQMGSKIL